MSARPISRYLSLHETEDNHGPDPHGVFTSEQTPETAIEAIAPVLRRSSAEQTAHEIQAAEHGWANDLGRMLHERTYLEDHEPSDPAAAEDRSQALQILDEAIRQQTLTHMTRIEDERPEWWHELPTGHSISRRTALAAVVQWRASSNQEEADTLYGRVPSSDEYLFRHYDVARKAITAAAEQQTLAPPELPEVPDVAIAPDTELSSVELVREHYALLAQHVDFGEPSIDVTESGERRAAAEAEQQRQIELQQQLNDIPGIQPDPGGPSVS